MDSDVWFLEQSARFLMVGVVVFFRVGAMVWALPGIGTALVPMRVRLAIALMLTIILIPVAPIEVAVVDLNWLILHIISETLAGLLIGLTFRLLVFALQVAGSMAAQATSLSQLAGPAGVEPMPAIGQVLTIAALALAMMAGMHVHAARFVLESYALWPAGTMFSAQDAALWMTERATFTFLLAFRIAAPFLALSVLYNLALGVINRAMPQLMVALVGAPLITGISLVALCVVAPIGLDLWLTALNALLENPF